MSDATAGWKPIETAPKDGKVVDLWCAHPKHGGVRASTMSWDDGKWLDWMGLFLNPGWTATHWRPLPDPPGHRGEQITKITEFFVGAAGPEAVDEAREGRPERRQRDEAVLIDRRRPPMTAHPERAIPAPATPRPWMTEGDHVLSGDGGRQIACTSATYFPREGDSLANAELIVRAVNAHDDLLLAAKNAVLVIAEVTKVACEAAGTRYSPGPSQQALMAAIAKAEGRTP